MSSPALDPATEQRLLEAATAAMQNAYAPYSQFKVGAALLTASGDVFTGCNVENASYSLANCAERTAIYSAVAQLGGEALEIRAVAVVNSADQSCSPCGSCRQVIWEFGKDALVIFRGPAGTVRSPITELLPYGFRLLQP